jgi:hypothetical protein
MIEILLVVVFALLIIGVAWWATTQLPLPAPFPAIIQVVLVLILVIVLLDVLLGFTRPGLLLR